MYIQTTWEKFIQAEELNDLYNESPLEDRLWAELKRLQLGAERQEYIQIGKDFFALDFAIYCAAGKLDIETDGDRWHSDPKRIPQDNFRDNALETTGWSLLRFNTRQINEQMGDYCLPTIAKEINNLHGLDEGGFIPRKVDLNMPRGVQQGTLFDGLRNREDDDDNSTPS